MTDRHANPRPEMSLGAFAYRVIIVILLGALALLLWKIVPVLLLLVGGIVIAALLRILSEPLARHAHLRHGWALFIVTLALLILLALAFYFLGDQVASQFETLQRELPSALRNLRQWVANTPLAPLWPENALRMGNGLGPVFQAMKVVVTGIGALAGFVLVLLLAIYLAAEPQTYLHGVLHLVPKHRRPEARDALTAAGTALKRWMMGQAIAMIMVGVLIGLGLSILGMPLALVLGIIAGLADFVPFVGPVAAALPALLLAVQEGGNQVVYVALLYFVVQQIEGNVTTPLAQKWAVNLPPAMALLAVSIFGLLFGFLGVLFAVPLMVLLMVLVKKLYVEDGLHDTDPIDDEESGRPGGGPPGH